jgi:hypothetical protein
MAVALQTHRSGRLMGPASRTSKPSLSLERYNGGSVLACWPSSTPARDARQRHPPNPKTKDDLATHTCTWGTNGRLGVDGHGQTRSGSTCT